MENFVELLAGCHIGAHYITDFAGGFSHAKFFKRNDETHFDFFIIQTPLRPTLGPTCLLSKIEQTSHTKLGCLWAWSDLSKFYIFEILMKNCTKNVSASST